MFIISHIISAQMANVKIFEKKKAKLKAETEFESFEAEKNRLDKIENFAILLPIIITVLVIIFMSILYKIFM